MDAKIAQISKEMARDMAAELEARFFRGKDIGTALDGTQDSYAEPKSSGEMMSSIRDLAEIMGQERDHGYRMGSLINECRASLRWKSGLKLQVDTMHEAWLKRCAHEWVVDARASVMRETAYVDPELLRTAEIRALENPS